MWAQKYIFYKKNPYMDLYFVEKSLACLICILIKIDHIYIIKRLLLMMDANMTVACVEHTEHRFQYETIV